MNESWILIVEDNADDVKLIVRALKRNNRPERPTICSDAPRRWKF